MHRVEHLRQQAELFRRVARTPAGRDPLLDRELLALADQLEQQANERLEYLHAKPQTSLPTAKTTIHR